MTRTSDSRGGSSGFFASAGLELGEAVGDGFGAAFAMSSGFAEFTKAIIFPSG
jgi:hypothetical protein